MFERFTRSAREVVVLTQEEARRLGHRQIGTPHLLLALLSDRTTAGSAEILRAHGVTAERVEQELATLLAREPRAAEDDAEALAALGIDIARIREAVEASFGPGALDRAPEAERRRPRGLLGRLTGGRIGGGRRDEVAALREAGRGHASHIPFSQGSKKVLELSLREALRLGDSAIDADHILLGVLRAGDGAAAVILSRLGVAVGDLRMAVEQRRRRSA